MANHMTGKRYNLTSDPVTSAAWKELRERGKARVRRLAGPVTVRQATPEEREKYGIRG